LIYAGVAALIWAIWCTRNDIIFKKKQFTSFMQVVFRGAYWLRFWSLLQREDTRESVRVTSKALEAIALEFFAKNGWRNNNMDFAFDFL
jgi:succinate-acetate transporter protein